MRESLSASENGWSALLYDGAGERLHRGPRYVVRLVDRIGGGDSFAAGLIYAIPRRAVARSRAPLRGRGERAEADHPGDFNRVSVAEVIAWPPGTRAVGSKDSQPRGAELANGRGMENTEIPDVPIPASRVGLGTWAMGGVQWGGTDDDESVRTIHAALDCGITLIDTAPAYGFGHSEEVVGRALAERGGRDRIVLATKVGPRATRRRALRNSTRKQLFEEIDVSLRRLRTDYIDLYQVHWPDLRTPYEETAAALLDLQRAGKIRAIGVSNYSIDAMDRFAAWRRSPSVQPPLNLFEREAEVDILPWCQAHGVRR